MNIDYIKYFLNKTFRMAFKVFGMVAYVCKIPPFKRFINYLGGGYQKKSLRSLCVEKNIGEVV